MPLPSLDLEPFNLVAGFDYLKFYFPIHGAALDFGADRCKSKPCHDAASDYVVTLHDPARREIEHLIQEGDDPALAGLELFVDFMPRGAVDPMARVALLEQCFCALVTRFRPEDHSKAGVGYKAAHRGSVGKPFHNRIPDPSEEAVFGHRSTGLNFKLYLKKKDQGKALPMENWRVRLEVSMDRYGLYLIGIDKTSSLLGFGYRRAFAKSFKIVDRATVRQRARWSPATVREVTERLERGWRAAGVHAVGHGPMPEDALTQTIAMADWRAANGRLRTIDPKLLVLHVHREANRRIGEALRQLDRRMEQRVSGGPAHTARAKSLLTEGFLAEVSRAIT